MPSFSGSKRAKGPAKRPEPPKQASRYPLPLNLATFGNPTYQDVLLAIVTANTHPRHQAGTYTLRAMLYGGDPLSLSRKQGDHLDDLLTMLETGQDKHGRPAFKGTSFTGMKLIQSRFAQEGHGKNYSLTAFGNRAVKELPAT